MPNPKLLDKYKGKPFGEIAKAINKKYEDRYDPISNRGKMAEMGSLRDEQEYQRTKLQIQENLKAALTQAQQPQQMVDPMQQQTMMPSNEGVSPEMMQQQPQGHPASQSYNQQFAYGGNMDYFGGGLFDSITTAPSSGMESFQPITAPARPLPAMNIQVPQSVQKAGIIQPQVNTQDGVNEQINPLRYAPLLANIYNIAATRKPKSTASTLQGMGVRTQVDESLSNQVQPRQTQFNNIDYSGIERGITNQARGFTGANMNASGGNAGSFVANELGNQGNVMNAIVQARMQQQQGNQQVAQLNAGEQARIDQFQLAQSGQQQQVQAQNIGIGMQMADLDARNQGAATSNRLANIAGLTTNLGTIGKEEDQMKMIANALGYSSFGNFMESMTPEERAKALPGLKKFILEGIIKSKN